MKKFLACLLVWIMMISMVPQGLFTIDVMAATSGDYTYTVVDGEAFITGYTGSDGDITIPSELDGYPVTCINYYAFDGCIGLTSVTIPDSVISIRNYAFSRADLVSINIGNSVNSIGEYAFFFCSALTSITVNIDNAYYSSVDGILFNKDQTTLICYPGGKEGAYTIPDSVKSIGDYAFYDCTGLTSVTIGNSVTSIGQSAFDGCTGLISATIGDSVTLIGQTAFEGCTGLTSVSIGNSVTNIGWGAFADCTGLTSVIIPNSVTSIGERAFVSCSGLKSVTLGNSVKSIGEWAFIGSGLTSVTIPASVTSIGDSAFKCDHITSITVEVNNTKYSSIEGVLFNKDQTTLIQYPGGKEGAYTVSDSVKSIGNYAFQNCTGLTSVTIPDSVTSIGESAFQNCTGLTSVIIGNSVTGIGSRAFEGCTALTSVIIPDTVTSIGYSAFEGCTGLTSITIPDSVTSIDSYVFGYCTGLTSVTIPDSVTGIDDSAFRGCTGLTSIIIPDSVTSIGSSAFEDCTGLTSITIPDSVTSIGIGAFGGCTGLTSITIPDSVTSIEMYAFEGCSGLTSITIPDSVTSIDAFAFLFCTGLTIAYIPETTTVSNAAFEGCDNLTIIRTSVNVGAADALKVAAAVQVPASIAGDSNSSGLDANKSVALYFNKNVAIDLDKTGALIVQCKADGVAVNYWKATITANTAYGSSNNYVVTINPDVNQTIGAVLDSAKTHSWATRAVVRLFDKTAGIDNFVGGVTSGTEKLAGTTPYAFGGCQDNGNINISNLANNTRDFYEVEITPSGSMPKITGAEWMSELGVKVTYSHPVSNAGRVWGGVRLVNSKGQLMCWLADTNTYVPLANATGSKIEYLQSRIDPTSAAAATQSFTLSQTSGQAFGSFAAGSKKSMSWFTAHLEACQAANPSDTFQLAYVIEESSSTATLGESANNWYMSGMYTADGKPLTVTHSRSTAGKDTIVMPLSDWDKVTVEKVDVTSDTTVQIIFSEPVLVTGNGYNSIRVTEKNNLVGPDNAAYQLAGSMAAVNPDADGYSAVWNFKGNSSITKFAHDKFFNDNYSVKSGVTLCMSLQSNTGTHGDGLTDYIVGKDGGILAASPYDHGADGTYVEIGNDPMFFADSIMTNVELIGQTDALITVTPIQNYGGTKSWRIIDGATGMTKVINGTNAIWTVKTWSNYLNGNTQMVASDMNTTLGVKTFDGIRGLMDADDKLVFAFSDNRVNGVIEGFFLASANGYKMQKAHFSTVSEDVAYFEVDVNVTKEALTVTDISRYDRFLQTLAYPDEYLVFTFSHDISDEMVARIQDGTIQVWITVKEKGSFGWPYDKGDGNGYVSNTSTPYHSKITPSNFNRYGNAGNKLVAAVSGSALHTLEEHVRKANEQYGYEFAELSVRFETSALTGLAGVNTYLTPVDSNVLPMVFDQGWSGGGRTYTNLLTEGEDIHVGTIELTDRNTAQVTFVDDNGDPVIVTNSLYNPGVSGLYVGIRLTKDGKLAWSSKAQLSSEGVGSALQFDASLKTKNGTTADSTWVLTCNGLADLIQAMNDPNGYYQKNGLDMAFGLEGGNVSGTGEIHDYLDAFTTLDGKGILQMIKSDTTQAHRYFYSYLNHKSNWITNGFVADTVKIVKAEPINNVTMQVTFDQPIQITGNQNYFRIVDGVNNLIRFDADKTTPLGNIMTVGEKDAAGSTSGLAQVGVRSVKADADGKVWNFTINGGIQGHYGFADIANFVAGLPASGNWNGSLKFALILEESNATGAVKNNGLSDHVVAADGSGAKLVNNQMGNGIGDGSCLDVTEDMVSDFVFANPLTVTSAKQINKNQLLVTFSEAVVIDNPWMGIRYVDENNELIYSNRDASGNTIKADSGYPMQWAASKWEWNNDEHTEIVVTFKPDIGVILDGSNLPDCLSPTTNPDYKYRFVMEESNPEQSGEAAKSGLVCDVYAVANPNNMLVNSFKFRRLSWDGHCAQITNVITPDTLITASDAKITGENQVTFEWSAPVDLSNTSNYYAAFRYVNTETGLMYGNATDGYMQIGAYMNYVGEGMTTMTAHVMPNTKWGVRDIDDLLNPTGALKEYMDAHPGKWVLCLEERSNGGNGTIDTFFGKDGTGILASPFIGSWADGVYIEITGEVIAGELSITAVEAIADNQIKVSFSAPVLIRSDVFEAIRWYNSNGNPLYWNPYTEEYTTVTLMRDKDGNRIYKGPDGYTTEKEGPNADGEWVTYAAQNNTPMQWTSHAWNWADDMHTAIIYTITGGADYPVKNISQIIAHDWESECPGSYIAFILEENTPDGIWQDGHVNNIVRADDPAIALDGNFFPHSRDTVSYEIEMAYTPSILTATTVTAISETQLKITFSEKVEIDGSPIMAVRLVDERGELLSSDQVNTSLEWVGSWTWADTSHRSIIWTMTADGQYNTLCDLTGYAGDLAAVLDAGRWVFVIEDNTVGVNGLIDGISNMSGQIHLSADAETADRMMLSIKTVVATPSAPVVAERTDESITLQAVDGYEYRLGNGEWTTNPVFIGLSPVTEYSFYQRIAETDSNYASLSSAAANISTLKSAVEAPAAPVLAQKTDTTITLVAVDGYEYKLGDGAWTTNPVFEGLSPNTEYVLYQRIAETAMTYPSQAGSGLTVTTLKSTVSAPAAPELAQKTDTTITLVAVDGYEYRMGNGAWKTEPVFTGLKPNATYTFSQRIAETHTTYVSESSVDVAFTTLKSTVAAPTAPVTAKVTDTTIILQATVWYEYKLGNGAWSASPVFEGLTPNTEYVLYQRVAETATTYASATSEGAVIVTLKSTAAAPAAPTVTDVTDTTVTLVAIDGYEYKLGDGMWTTNPVFTGLAPNTEYTFYQRVAETQTAYAGEVSVARNVTTLKSTVTAPAAPTVAQKTDTSVTLVAVDGYEYKINDGEWTANPTFTGLTPNAAYVFYQRSAETDSVYVSPVSVGVTVTTLKSTVTAPAAPIILTKSHNSIIVKAIGGYEYKLGDGVWTTDPVFTNLAPNTSYTVYQRIAETATVYASPVSVGTVEITLKSTVPAPAAPVVVGKTDTTVTLQAIGGYEYRMNEGEWTADPVFTGLAPNTEYTFYQRVAETQMTYAGARSEAVRATTLKITVDAPAAPSVFSISSSCVILMPVSGYEYKMNDGDWTCNPIFGNLAPNTTYTFYQRVAQTGTAYASEAGAAAMVTTLKASVAAPSAPVIAGKTDTTVTLQAVAGYEYKLGDGAWTTDPIFTGLTPNTTYAFYQRMAQTDVSYAGQASAATIVLTPKSVVTAPSAPTVYNKTDSVIILQPVNGCEYKLGDGAWTTNPIFTGLDPNKEYTFYARIAESNTNYVSDSSVGMTATTLKSTVATPVAPVVAEKTDTTITLQAVVGYEYKLDDGAWTTDPIFTGLKMNTEYTVYQRVAETETTYASDISVGVKVTTMASGWVSDSGVWYYLINGKLATGWQIIDGIWYYFNSTGAMMTGWVNDGGTWYYMAGNGAMMTGWVNDGGTWYYMNAGGAMHTGWLLLGGTWYYMGSGGAMHIGWALIGGVWYYMDASGAWVA